MKVRRKNQRGLTLIELIVAFTILMMLSAMAVPMARYKVRREREKQLRLALDDIRRAIDKYKDDADQGKLGQQKLDSMGYPESLEILVEGVKMSGQVDTKKKYLRRIPTDPSPTPPSGACGACRTIPSPPPGVGRTYSTCIRRPRRAPRTARPIRNGEPCEELQTARIHVD